MKNDKKMLNEVNQMKNLMKYMDGEKVNTKQIKENIINEEPSNQYGRKIDVDVSISYGDKHYIMTDNGVQGVYIEQVYSEPIYVTFNIDIDMREWGIKDISLYNISGPSEIDVMLSYYMEGDDDPREMETKINLDWENISTEKQTGGYIITIGDELEVWLQNDESGNLTLKDMTIKTYEMGSDD